MLPSYIKFVTSGSSYTYYFISRTLFTTLKFHSSDSKSKEISDTWVDQFQISDIPKHSYQITFAKSRGPGGQHVNKCNSKVLLRLPLVPPPTWLPSYCVNALQASSKHLLSKSCDELIIASDQSRSQYRNIEKCLLKLVNLIKKAGKLPKETSIEKQSKIKLIEKMVSKKRLEKKKRRKEVKETRKINWDDL